LQFYFFMEFSQLFCELLVLSEDIKLVVDKMLADTRLKCQFSKETDIKKQVLEYFLQLLKKNQKNQDSIQKLSDEDKKKLIKFFGYDSLIKAEAGPDREEMILRFLLEFEIDKGIYYFGDVDKEGKLNGEATITYGKHCIYEGAVKNGLPDGQGKIFSSSEAKVAFYYEGTFEQDLPNGENINIDNKFYEGTWKNYSMLTKDENGDRVEIRFIIDQNKIPSFVVEEEKANYYDCSSFFNFLTILTKCNPFTSCIPKAAKNINDHEICL